jgi:UDP-N-acetylglucosamine:LPS N-acetylglucosamine transferase
MITDREAPQKLVSEALSLMKNEEQKASLGRNCKSMSLPGSASKIVDEIMKLTMQGD